MNSFDPPTINPETGRTYKQERYEQILEEQVMISYVSKGISITDTDYMTPFDRQLVLKILTKIRDKEKELLENSLN